MSKYTLVFFYLMIFLLFASCNNAISKTRKSTELKELEQLAEMMSGTFSSKEQAQLDSSFYNINLVMYPIWEENTEVKWLYVEQAVTEYIDQPYRQRIYRLSTAEDGQIESRVYELRNPVDYVHAWEKPTIFTQITPDSLLVREGCSVFLKKSAKDCYVGATKEDNCKSTLRGATYATSKVTICPNQVVSWDQGWDDSDTQVWGAVKEGYVFKKLNR